MQLTQLSDTGLYLENVDSPETAVWGLMMYGNRRPQSVTLATSFSNADSFYVFFPAADRGAGWAGFAKSMDQQMDNGTNRRFGFFDNNATLLGVLSVTGSGGSQALNGGQAFTFRNLVLKVQQPSTGQASVTYDDGSQTFFVENLAVGAQQTVQWLATPPGGTERPLTPTGNLAIPVAGPTPGVLRTELMLSLDDQSALECGPMYFAPDSDGGDVIATRYPTFLSGDDGTHVAVTAFADVAQQTEPDRTYFALTDTSLKSGFSSVLGRQITLAPRDGSNDPQKLSTRFVLADRPVTGTGKSEAYFLTPMGAVSMAQDSSASAGELLCAYSATESFTFENGDVLHFWPGKPAWLVNSPESVNDKGDKTAAVYLDDQATTSWISLTSDAAQTTYFSQPQGSPIYEDDGQTGDAEVKPYKLKFKQIPAWPAPGNDAANATCPPVPMAPYGGLSGLNKDSSAPFAYLESKGINPARRQVLSQSNPHQSLAPMMKVATGAQAGTLTNAMTPLGLVGGFDANNIWMTTHFAVSGAQNDHKLQFEDMGDALRSAFYQNQIFMVIDQDTSNSTPLFSFGKTDATVELSDWFFDLRLQGEDPDGVPPILIIKFFRDKSIKELVSDRALWEAATTFSSDPKSRESQILDIIDTAEAAVKKDPNSIYANFVKVVNDPGFTGLLALNTALDLQELPAVIKALLGGMVDEKGNSNIAAFRAHHVGVSISDTGNGGGVELESSSVFALVDYEDPSTTNTSLQSRSEKGLARDLDVLDSIYPCGANGLTCYGFKVIYLRALFTNNALSSFDAEVDLTVDNLFAVGVNLGNDATTTADGEKANIIKINGSYSEHDGAQTYSFVAKKTYEFTFDDNTYLKKITFDKVQFSATEEETGNATTSTISSRFAIWGAMEFKELEFLDMFSFEKLSFADLGIEMSYQLIANPPPAQPETRDLSLKFSPGNLRFDFGQTKQRDGDKSLLALLPFKLKSFLYSEDGQDISKLDYFDVGIDIPGVIKTGSVYNFALIFDLDLGSLGGLVGDLSAFKFSMILGWKASATPADEALVFGIQMPEADGKLELTIEGVLKISIDNFQLKYTDDDLLVVAMIKSYMELFGTRVPPGNVNFDLAIFAPQKGDDKIGWIAALNAEAEKKKTAPAISFEGPMQAVQEVQNAISKAEFEEFLDHYETLPDEERREMARVEPLAYLAEQKKRKDGDGGDEGGSLLKLDYFGIGQRVGPKDNLDNFDAFLKYMKGDFWTAVEKGKYTDVYKPDGGWIVVTNLVLLDLVGLGFVFYDSTPFYSLKIYITKGSIKGLSFEITYTKVSDDVGLFFVNFTLPDALRTFQAGAASITLPALKLSIYTNGDFKVDLGFPANDDWSVCFRVEAFAGPIPVTGSGGFYIAKLSSATDDTFTAKDYDTILAAGFGARLGVGKNFVAGPLKAGVSLTFFGIIEGAIGYYAYDDSEDVIQYLTDPKALAIKGQFGVIGEIYGSIDFAIIKASVNVRIQASVGVQLLIEAGLGGDIMLYVEASVSVGVKVKIGLGFFSITISFSFKASFRFEWHLLRQDNAQHVERLAMRSNLAMMAVADAWNPDFPLQTGLNGKLSSWMIGEYTTVWSDTSAVGAPWLATSLTMEYLDDTSGAKIEDFKPFENLAAQMITWALSGALGIQNWDASVSQKDIDGLNQNPDLLTGGLDYATLIAGMGKMFSLDIISVPTDTKEEDAQNVFATIFPMLPFLTLKTSGRDGELDYAFQSKSNVSQNWIDTTLQTYFEELYTNITSEGGGDEMLAEMADPTVPLVQAMFVDWFDAAIRSTNNALLTQMQNDETDSGKLSDIFLAAVQSGQLKTVAGQMAQFFRSGLRLPKTDGMELPAGSLEPTNPLYALIWQEFPVGSKTDYTVSLTGDSAQPWVTSSATWAVKSADVTPYAINGGDLPVPSHPAVIPVLQSGPQAFALANPITWTPGGGAALSLRPFPASMLTALKSGAPLNMSLFTRETSKSYDLATDPVPTADTKFALSIDMVIRKVPGSGGASLANTYALGAADLTQQTMMRELMAALQGGQVKAEDVQLLYQTSADESGLVSDPAAKQLFVLRTNTTTQSVPPATMEAMLLTTEQEMAVGANADDPLGFLQILEQSSVTNQTGYFLTYETSDGKGLPDDLFGSQNFAQVTFVIKLDIAPSGAVYALPNFANAAVLTNTKPDLLYYAETTDAADETQYVSTAAGTLGFEMKRTEPTGDTVLDRLANLYSLVAYQVPSSTGFRASGLSVPASPQKPEDGDTTQTWRLFAPLYKLATDNPAGDANPNRYASIGDTVSIQSVVVDAFGNSFGAPTAVIEDQTNLFFDDLVPLGNWTGVRTIFDFNAWDSPTDNTVCASIDSNTGLATGGDPKPGALSVYLCPSVEALPKPGSQSALATAEMYDTVINQLSAKGPSGQATTEMFVTANLDSSGSDIALDAAQTAAVMKMLGDLRDYLVSGGAQPTGATLSVTVPGATDTLPLVFEIQVDFGIKRTAFLSPDVQDYANATRVVTNIPPQSDPEALRQLANDFAVAFPAFTLATGPADADDVVVQSLAPEMLAAETGKASASQPKGLWAVSTAVTDLQISQTRRAYLAPKPLDTRLRSGTVVMPNTLAGLGSLPDKRAFSDVDLDQMARTAFGAIDNILGAENASRAFEQAPAAYTAIANAREQIADRYADNEVAWLLNDVSYQGQGSDLCQGQDLMAQQMRSALGSAYAINTIVQTDVSFTHALPPSMDNRLQLFGQMQRTGSTNTGAQSGGGFGLGTARVDVPDGAGGQKATTSFLYGVTDQKIEEETYETMDLEWAVSHLQVFLDPRQIDYCDHGTAAPPSIWLQFINAFTHAPQMGETVIPLAYRDYPTPPSMVVQSAEADIRKDPKTLGELTLWYYTAIYQARLLTRDEVMLDLIYNTGGSDQVTLGLDAVDSDAPQTSFTLFEALARFQAGYDILQPQLSPVPETGAKDALESFATLVTQLANNSNWVPDAFAMVAGSGLTYSLEQDLVTDMPTGTGEARKITLIPDPMAPAGNPWIGNKCVAALDPTTMKPYADEEETCSTPGNKIVETTYTPDPPLNANFVTHRVRARGLTTLAYENANSGIGTRRNAHLFPDPKVFSNPAFIYQTPIVAGTNPITPFVQNDTAFQIYPMIVPDKDQDMGTYIATTLEELMGVATSTRLMADAVGDMDTISEAATRTRRIKIDARYGFPIGSPSGSGDQAETLVPLSPMALVRSFDLPVDGLAEAIVKWVGQSGDPGTNGLKPYAAVLADWLTTQQGLVLGKPNDPNAPPPGAFLSLDVTLYSQLDAANNQQPLLRLSDLRLALAAVKTPGAE